MRLESLCRSEHDFRASGDELAPGIAARVVDVGGNQAKRAAAGIGANVEDAGRIASRAGMVVDVIFVVVLPRIDQAECRVRLSCRKEANFAGRVARDSQQEKGAAARAFDIDAKTFVRFFVEERVGFARA